MVKTRRAILLAFCFALAACADAPTGPGITPPDAQLAAQLTLLEDPADRARALITARIARSAAQRAEVDDADDDEQQVPTLTPTGGTAEGSANVPTVDGRDSYSFRAETNGVFPLAEGWWRGTIVITGAPGMPDLVAELEAKVDCLVIQGQAATGAEPAGNNAFLSGPIKSFTVDGQPVPEDEIAGLQFFVRVLDVDGNENGNGENGDGTNDGGNDDDNDGLTNDDELRLGLLVNDADSDDDGIRDGDDDSNGNGVPDGEEGDDGEEGNGDGNDLASEIVLHVTPQFCATRPRFPVKPEADVTVRPDTPNNGDNGDGDNGTSAPTAVPLAAVKP
jgi:hypothetical protein